MFFAGRRVTGKVGSAMRELPPAGSWPGRRRCARLLADPVPSVPGQVAGVVAKPCKRILVFSRPVLSDSVI